VRFAGAIFLFSALTYLAGCAAPTEAQRTAQIASSATKNAAAEFKSCRLKVWQKPEYASILSHLPDEQTSQFTMEQLADKSVPTLEEAKALASLYDDMGTCRAELKSALSTSRPDLLPAISEQQDASTNITLKLVQRSFSWGQAAQATQAASTVFRQKMAAANQQFIADLKAENQEEMAQRREEAAIMLGYMQNQQIYSQQQLANQQQTYNQQLILNSLNRPVNTSCLASGSMINCISQ
jgi:hypothetical protein